MCRLKGDINVVISGIHKANPNLWYETKPILGLSWHTRLWHTGLRDCAESQARHLNKPVTFGVQLTQLPLEDMY